MKAKDIKPGVVYRVARSNDFIKETWGSFEIVVLAAGVHEHKRKKVGYFETSRAAHAYAAAHPELLEAKAVKLTEDNISWTEKEKIGQWKLTAFGPVSIHTAKNYAIGYRLDRDGEPGELVSVTLASIKMEFEEWKKEREAFEKQRQADRDRESAHRAAKAEVAEKFEQEIKDLFGESSAIRFSKSYGRGGSIVFNTLDAAEKFLAVLKEAK